MINEKAKVTKSLVMETYIKVNTNRAKFVVKASISGPMEIITMASG